MQQWQKQALFDMLDTRMYACMYGCCDYTKIYNK